MRKNRTSPSPRPLNTLDAITLTFSSMVGAGIFTVLALTVKTAGVNAVWAWIGIVILSFPMALSFSDLTGVLSASGGPYIFLRDHIHRRLGLFVAWSFWLSSLGAASALLSALIHMFGQIGVPLSTWVGLFILLILVIITTLGIHVGLHIQRVLTASTLFLLIISIILGVSHGLWQLLQAHDRSTFFHQKITHMWLPSFGKPLSLATFFAFWTYSGWEAVAVPSNAYKDQKALGNGMIIGSTLVGVIYILVAFAAILALPVDQLASKANPLVMLGNLYNPWLGQLIAWGALAVVVSSLLSWMLATATLTQALLKDKLLPAPRSIRSFSGEYHPLLPLLIGLILAILAVLPVFSEAIAASSLTALIPYTIVFLAVAFHRTANWDGLIKTSLGRRVIAFLAAGTAILLTIFSGITNLLPTAILLAVGGLLVWRHDHTSAK